MRSSVGFIVCLFCVVGCDVPPAPAPGGGSAPNQVNQTPATPETPPPEDRSAAARYTACSAAPKLIGPVLKAPSTAKFPWSSEVSARRGPDIEGTETWFVDGYVDSQNDFGAMLRSPWQIGVAFYGDEVVPLFATVDGQTVYGDPGIMRNPQPAPKESKKPKKTPREPKPEMVEEPVEVDPVAAAEKLEKEAAGKLKLAKSVRLKNESGGNDRLREIVEKYPGTEAAEEAAKILAK